MKQKTIQWKKVIVKLLISVVLISGIIVGGYFLLRKFGITNMTQEELQSIIKNTGAWGPIVFVLVSFLQVTFIPIPSAIVILSGNFLFGPWLGFLYSFIGIMLGSSFAFLLGRIAGRPFVNWVAGDKEVVDDYLKRSKGKETIIFFFMFLLPMFPDDTLCAIAGITPISWPLFLVMQIICRPIGIFGTMLFMSGDIIPYHGWGLVVIGLVAILSIVAFIFSYKHADKINNFIERIGSAFMKKIKKNNSGTNDKCEDKK